MSFSNYAQYYDLLYKDKDYKGEAEYIISLFDRFSPKQPIRILDIGCGTGIHDELIANKGYQVDGIDLSEEMIQIAMAKKSERTSYSVGNATEFSRDKKYDTIVSLFHVVSYQTSNQNVDNMFSCVSKHLDKGGLFIFDFWYGPTVLTMQPEVRIKRLINDTISVTRLAEPAIFPNRNVVDVNYELLITNHVTGELEKINEVHPMRYFFIPELNIFLEKNGLTAICFEEWMTKDLPSLKTWGVCCVAIKK